MVLCPFPSGFLRGERMDWEGRGGAESPTSSLQPLTPALSLRMAPFKQGALFPLKVGGVNEREKHILFCSLKMVQGTICPFSNSLSLSPSSSPPPPRLVLRPQKCITCTPILPCTGHYPGSRIPASSAEPLGWGWGGAQEALFSATITGWERSPGSSVSLRLRSGPLLCLLVLLKGGLFLWTESSLRAETFSAWSTGFLASK